MVSGPVHDVARVTNTPTGPGTLTFARRWYVLAVLCLSLLIVTVGNASLNVTLPTLSRDLGATETQLQWVVAIYSLVFEACCSRPARSATATAARVRCNSVC